MLINVKNESVLVFSTGFDKFRESCQLLNESLNLHFQVSFAWGDLAWETMLTKLYSNFLCCCNRKPVLRKNI